MKCTLMKIAVLAVVLSGAVAFGGSVEERLEKVEAQLENLEGSTGTTVRAYWKDGLKFESADGAFKVQVGGRLMNDWLWWPSGDRDIESSIGESLDDGTEFRRARFFIAGTMWEVVKFKAQYDFAGGDADLKDAYIELVKVPIVGAVKAGHFKEPMGLGELTSSKYITFMEPALPMAFAASRNTGIMLHNEVLDKRMTWAVGFFRDTDDYGSGSSDCGGYNATGRVTGVVWQDKENKCLAHLGASYSHRSPSDNEARFRRRPEIHQTDRWVNTGKFDSNSVNIAGLEGALVLGPASFQAEYLGSWANSSVADDPSFSGWYVQASYFLTGESRPYKKGTWSRVKPAAAFHPTAPGKGAWEVALRYSTIDLDDGLIAGGDLSDVTLGLNWYLNPNTRIMWNWVHADLDKVGEADALQMRFQIDF